MASHPRIVGLTLFLVTVAAAVFLGGRFPTSAPRADAQPGGAASSASGLVTLQSIGASGQGCPPSYLPLDFARVLPDASRVDRFRVPRGQVLVVTDIDWAYRSTVLGETQDLLLSLVNQADPTKEQIVFQSPILMNAIRFGDGQAFGGANVHLTSGFAVSSQALLCVDVFPGAGGFPAEPGTPRDQVFLITLHGYLTADR